MDLHAEFRWSRAHIDVGTGPIFDRPPRPINAIQPREIMALIEGIEDRGAGEIATRVLQRVRAVFSRAVALGYREVNPASELRNHLKPRKKGQQTALAAEELHKVSGYSQWLMPGRLWPSWDLKPNQPLLLLSCCWRKPPHLNLVCFFHRLRQLISGLKPIPGFRTASESLVKTNCHLG